MIRIRDYMKDKWAYYLVGCTLLVVSLLLIIVTNNGDDYTLQLPTTSIFGRVTFATTIIIGLIELGLIGFFLSKEVPLEKIFLIIAIPLGIAYMVAIPLGKIPDEEIHIRKAVAIAQGNLFSTVSADGSANEEMEKNISGAISQANNNSYENAFKWANIKDSGEKASMWYSTMALYAPVCHLPQALGVLIARIFGANMFFQAYNARVMNFMVAVSLIYFAIKNMPIKKEFLMFIALSPIAMNELVSISSDALTIGISLFWISYIFKIKYDESIKTLSIKNNIILIILAIIVSMCKIVYIPLCLLLLIVPREKFGSLKKKCIWLSIIIGVATILNLLWLAYASRFLIPFNPGVNSKEQVIFILTHPVSYFLILFRTMAIYTPSYIQGLCGTLLSELNVNCSGLFIYTVIPFMFFTSVVNYDNNDTKIDTFTKFVSITIAVLIILLIYTAEYVQWTPYKQSEIWGVQSRYFIPILMLFAVTMYNNKYKVDGKKSYKYMFIFMLFYNLNAITNIIYKYI